MEYVIYKLVFTTGVHFGDGSLYTSRNTFRADTLFSALCIEAMKISDNYMDRLLGYVRSGEIVFSDAMPYTNNTFYVPKPMTHIEQNVVEAKAVSGKVFKNILYINSDEIGLWMHGEYDPGKNKGLEDLGYYEVRDLVAIRGEEDPLPYRIGIYHYQEGNGLYVLVAYEDDEKRDLFEELLSAVSLVGIGGKRASGLGRFVFVRKALSPEMKKRLAGDYTKYMLLSGGLPEDGELEEVLRNADYRLSLRSGFVQSDHYAEGQLRKKDCYMLDAGSVLEKRFKGNVIDISAGGRHPVYRYAMPLFMGVAE